MKKKFEIIEEGRLSKSEMGNIAGGGDSTYTCTPSNKYKVVTACMGGGSLNYSQCPIYGSCVGNTQLSCKSYGGPTVPGGLSSTIDNLVVADIPYSTLYVGNASNTQLLATVQLA
jgi:hypothetical protein